MIKPILKIELPSSASKEHADEITQSLKDSEVAKEYHILVISGMSDYISVEIIIASDPSIHKP